MRFRRIQVFLMTTLSNILLVNIGFCQEKDYDYFYFLGEMSIELWFELDNSKIVEQKVRSVERGNFKISAFNRPKDVQNYVIDFVQFNEFGNPNLIFTASEKETWWWPRLWINLKLAEKPVDSNRTYFYYNQRQMLVKRKSYRYKAYSSSWEEEENVIFLDSNGNQISIVNTRIRAYPPGFKYRGVAYKNDTSISSLTCYYDSKGCLTYSVTTRSDWDKYKNAKPVDTHYYDQRECEQPESVYQGCVQNQTASDTLESTSELYVLIDDSFQLYPINEVKMLNSDLREKARLILKDKSLTKQGWRYYENGLLILKHYGNSSNIVYFEYKKAK